MWFIFFHFLPFHDFFCPFFGYFWPPCMPTVVPKVRIWSWFLRYTFSDDESAKTELIFHYCSHFGLGAPEKVVLEVCYAVLTLSWGPKCPKGPHIDLYPYFHVLPRQPTKKKILFANFVHYFSFSPFLTFLGTFFWRFLTPHYAFMSAQGPHMDLNPESYPLSVESAKKQILFIDSFNFFQFFAFCSGFCSFGVKKGHFKRVEQARDAPQWPLEVLPVFIYTNHSHKILGSSK